MAALNAEQHDVVQALVRDVAATIGVRDEAELTSYLVDQGVQSLEWNLEDFDTFRQKLVDDFQQCLHDQFVEDVSWPRCPRHPHHPMWLKQGQWYCTRDDVVIARLGELPSQPSDRKESNGSL